MKKKAEVKIYNPKSGCLYEVDFEAAVNLMCDDLRELLHEKISSSSKQDFIDKYADLHETVYGEFFVVD